MTDLGIVAALALPTRVLVAYAMIAVIVVIALAVAMHLTRGRRSYHSAVRRYRRARKEAHRRDAKLARSPGARWD